MFFAFAQVAGKDGGAYRGVVSGLSYMWRTEGMKGFFKGNGANCVRIVPNSAVKFLCYDHMSHAILRARQTVDATAEMDVLTRQAGGAGAGIIAMSATYPLDMVRGRLTVQKAAADGSMNGQYRGIAHAFSVILQKEGMGAFYKGWTPSVIGVIPYVGLNFAIYETLKDVATTMQGLNSPKDLDVASGLACGGVAGAVGQTVAYPFDVCRRRLQVSGWVQAGATSGPVYTGMMDCFRQTVRNEGFGALFHGLSANYVKIMPSIAIAFVVYDKAKLALFSEGEAYAKISSS